jgi:hypothetical protein
MARKPPEAHPTIMRSMLLVPVVFLAMLTGTGASQGASPAPFCTGRQLSGTFRVIPGSAGAGNVVYALRLRNRSGQSCSVTGLPLVWLLGRTGRPLPTQEQAAKPSALTPVLVTLRPGQAARATARFSPDVPGPGEPTLASGQCEPTAYRLHVVPPGGGATAVPVSPPTPVCEHGSLQLSAYGRS